jgi:two-component system, OmpR family, response regulator CpxR
MKRHILIVEDERAVWKQLGQVLDADDYELECMQTGHEALRRSLDELFDLVVLDLSLSDMDGWKVLDWFYRFHPFLAVVALTRNDKENVAASLLGASACVKKPLNHKDLVRTIERVLAESPQERVSRSMAAFGGTVHVPEPHTFTAA